MTRTTPRKARKAKPARRALPSSMIRHAIHMYRHYCADMPEIRHITGPQLRKAEAQLAALLEDSRRRP